MLIEGYDYGMPDNGNAKNFSNFVKKIKFTETFNIIKNNKNILNLIKATDNNLEFNILERFTIEDYEQYFSYLKNIKTDNNNWFKIHMNWISNHITYEELYKISKIFPKIKITSESIIYNNDLEEGVFHFF